MMAISHRRVLPETGIGALAKEADLDELNAITR